MNFFNLIMIGFGIGIGMLIQRLFHIIEDSSQPPPRQIVKAPPTKVKKSLREITSCSSLITPSTATTTKGTARRIHRSDRSVLKTETTKRQSKSASPAISPAILRSKESVATISSPVDVSMSNLSPQSSSTASSTTTTSGSSTASTTTTTSMSGNTSEPTMGTTQHVTPGTPPLPANVTITKFEVIPATTEEPLESMATTKVEKVVSPRRAVIRPSQAMCDCGVELMDEKEKYSNETTMPNPLNPMTFTNKTKILPMCYDRYRPLNLIHPPDGPTELSPAVTKKQDIKEETTLLTPFKPILHSMYYAHRHALLIGELLENYDHLEE